MPEGAFGDQWDYTKRHGPTCHNTLVGGECNCPYSQHEKARLMAAGGFWCQNCSRVLVRTQGDICSMCREDAKRFRKVMGELPAIESGALVSGSAPAPGCYHVVSALGDVSELDRECSRLMALGWKAHGNLVIAAHFDQRQVFVVEYFQPMIRPVELVTEPPAYAPVEHGHRPLGKAPE